MFSSDKVSGLADSPPLLRMYRWYLDLGSPEDRFVLHIRTDHGRESVDGRMMVPATLIGPLPCLRCPSAPSQGNGTSTTRINLTINTNIFCILFLSFLIISRCFYS